MSLSNISRRLLSTIVFTSYQISFIILFFFLKSSFPFLDFIKLKFKTFIIGTFTLVYTFEIINNLTYFFRSTKCDVIITVEDLRRRHSMIHSLCEDINNIYSLQIFFTVAHIFIAIIVYLMTLVRTAKLQSFLYQLYSILVILNCVGKLTVTCFVCTWIKTEVRFAAFNHFSIFIRAIHHAKVPTGIPLFLKVFMFKSK